MGILLFVVSRDLSTGLKYLSGCDTRSLIVLVVVVVKVRAKD